MADLITAERARELFSYDPETGHLVRILKTSPHIKMNTQVTCKDRHGYLFVSADHRQYRVHRLVWLMMTGEWPTADVDHINMVRDDNRWVNLRAATRSQNMANSRVRPSEDPNKSKGIVRTSCDGWQVTITKDGRTRCFGTFGNKETAEQVYREESARLFGEFARHD